ncbi:MAG: hypothetical protein LBL45_06790 [Treponema sp.]|nr:hypothetical protein [Treponema sp.]
MGAARTGSRPLARAGRIKAALGHSEQGKKKPKKPYTMKEAVGWLG